MTTPTRPDAAPSSPARQQRTDADRTRADVTSQLEQAGKDGAAAAKNEARSRLEQGKEATAQTASETAEALDAAADRLSTDGNETLARMVSGMAEKLTELAEGLEHQSLDDLTRQARRIARRNPALFALGGVAVGLALSRFFKASPDDEADAEPATRPGDAVTIEGGRARVSTGEHRPGTTW